MLGKLLKHDFKSTGKVLLPLNIILVAATILGAILLSLNLLQRLEMAPIAILLLITYILMILTLSIVTEIFLIVSYYRNLFSAQGYLTFTLPASSWSLLHSKMIVGFVWSLVNSMLTLGSALLLVGAACGFGQFSSVLRGFLIGDIAFSDSANTLAMTASFSEIFGYTPAQLILLFILMLTCACFYSVAVGYGSVTIGQLYAKHKVVGAVIAYIAFYFLMQIITSAFMVISALRSTFDLITQNPELTDTGMLSLMSSIYKPIFPVFIVVYLVIGIGCYVASGVIMKKKVNLD